MNLGKLPIITLLTVKILALLVAERGYDPRTSGVMGGSVSSKAVGFQTKTLSV